MQELLPTIVSVNTTALTPDTGGEAQPIVLDFGQGEGARIISIEWLVSHGNATHDVAFALSTDPNEAAPTTLLAMAQQTDVLDANNLEVNLTTSGGFAHYSIKKDLSVGVYVVTRNLACIAYTAGSSGDSIVCRVHYNQVIFSDAELRAITITNR